MEFSKNKTFKLTDGYGDESIEKLLCDFSHIDDAQEVTVDISEVTSMVPAVILILFYFIMNWSENGCEITIIYQNNNVFQHLQRIDFINLCGFTVKENLPEKSQSEFIPIKKIISRGSDQSDLSIELATLIAPELANEENPDESGLFDLVIYSISELVNNVIDHSKGIGFAFAQYDPNDDLVRICIIDNGIGIRSSFKNTGSPHFDDKMTDSIAIGKALEPQVSSKTHLQGGWGDVSNAGVGLTFLKALSENLEGDLTISSGKGLYKKKQLYNLETSDFTGTLSAISFKRSKIKNFYDLLNSIKRNFNLLKRKG